MKNTALFFSCAAFGVAALSVSASPVVLAEYGDVRLQGPIGDKLEKMIRNHVVATDTEYIPAPFQEMLADAEAVFTASEGRIRQFALDSLALDSPALDKIRSDCQKALPKIAKERYERAFAAFTEHFSHFGEDASA